MRALAATLVLLLAGCTAPLQDHQETASSQLPFGAVAMADTATHAEAVVQPAAVTRHDWFVLPLLATPEGAAAGYRIPVPPDALVPSPFDETRKELVLEVAPLGAGTHESLHVEVGQSGRVLAELTSFSAASGWGAGANANSYNAGIAGAYVQADAVEGRDLFLVVAARGTGDATVGVRFADKAPWAPGSFTPPARDADEFRHRSGGRAPLLPAETGRAAGVDIDFFYDYKSVTSPGVSRFATGGMRVTEGTPDGAVRPVTVLELEASKDGTGSYATALGWVWTELHAGRIVIAVAAPGQPTGTAYVVTPAPIVSGSVVSARGDGDGVSGAYMDVKIAGTPSLFPQLTLLAHIRMGAPMSVLAGEPVASESQSFGSSARPPVLDGTVVRLESAGIHYVYALPSAR